MDNETKPARKPSGNAAYVTISHLNTNVAIGLNDRPPLSGPVGMLVDCWFRRQRGRRSGLMWRRRPRGIRGHKDFRRRRPVAQ